MERLPGAFVFSVAERFDLRITLGLIEAAAEFESCHLSRLQKNLMSLLALVPTNSNQHIADVFEIVCCFPIARVHTDCRLETDLGAQRVINRAHSPNTIWDIEAVIRNRVVRFVLLILSYQTEASSAATLFPCIRDNSDAA